MLSGGVFQPEEVAYVTFVPQVHEDSVAGYERAIAAGKAHRDTISVIVECREFSGDDKWIVIVEKLRHTDEWTNTDTMSRQTCQSNAEAAAIEWIAELVEMVVLAAADITTFIDDGWTIVWR